MGLGAFSPWAHLDEKSKVMVEYNHLAWWHSSSGGFDIRGKSMILDKKPTAMSEIENLELRWIFHWPGSW